MHAGAQGSPHPRVEAVYTTARPPESAGPASGAAHDHDRTCSEQRRGRRTRHRGCLVPEPGGLLSPLALFPAARREPASAPRRLLLATQSSVAAALPGYYPLAPEAATALRKRSRPAKGAAFPGGGSRFAACVLALQSEEGTGWPGRLVADLAGRVTKVKAPNWKRQQQAVCRPDRMLEQAPSAIRRRQTG